MLMANSPQNIGRESADGLKQTVGRLGRAASRSPMIGLLRGQVCLRQVLCRFTYVKMTISTVRHSYQI